MYWRSECDIAGDDDGDGCSDTNTIKMFHAILLLSLYSMRRLIIVILKEKQDRNIFGKFIKICQANLMQRYLLHIT